MQRGKIRNRERAKQLRDFSGLRFGRRTPTDMDGFLELRDKVGIVIEGKHEKGALVGGQRMALTRLCKWVADSGRKSYVLVVEHSTNSAEDVDYASLPVVEVCLDGEWRKPKVRVTCREACDHIIAQAGLRL